MYYRGNEKCDMNLKLPDIYLKRLGNFLKPATDIFVIHVNGVPNV